MVFARFEFFLGALKSGRKPGTLRIDSESRGIVGALVSKFVSVYDGPAQLAAVDRALLGIVTNCGEQRQLMLRVQRLLIAARNFPIYVGNLRRRSWMVALAADDRLVASGGASDYEMSRVVHLRPDPSILAPCLDIRVQDDRLSVVIVIPEDESWNDPHHHSYVLGKLAKCFLPRGCRIDEPFRTSAKFRLANDSAKSVDCEYSPLICT